MENRGNGASRRAVIDIGSNSIRLVVFDGPARLPTVLLNEKLSANLGRTLSEDGRLPKKAVDAAMTGLRRFAILLQILEVKSSRVVATAAVRDAENGGAFLDSVRALGLTPELLSGEEEANASAMGVLSAFPDADGIVGDLGGGSLELVGVGDHMHGRGDSFPLGTLRLPKLREWGPDTFERHIKKLFGDSGWSGSAAGRKFYLVGGAWRALAQLAMHDARYPLFDPHGYTLSPDEPLKLLARIAESSPKELREIPYMPGSRVASLGDAAALLAAVTRHLKPAALVVSSFGLREGLLYAALPQEIRDQDPLMVAAEDACLSNRCSPEQGALLDRWIAPLFDDDAKDAGIRRAACLLGAVVRLAERKARAGRSMELALHERWIGLDPRGRAMLAAAMLVRVGERQLPHQLGLLADAASLQRAVAWGASMRLADKLVGPALETLDRIPLSRDANRLSLRIDPALQGLHSEGSEQQLAQIASLLGLSVEARVPVVQLAR
ncbi:MAG TPA: Ppx/GppA family phosphatase [Sphingomicrobium sp.]